MKIVVVSPHRDDAAFSLTLAIIAWIAEGHSVEVINCFTRSEYAPFSDSDSLHPNDRLSYVTALRAREDHSWQRQLGPRLRMHDVNLKDAPLRLRCALDEVCTLPVRPTDKAFAKLHTVFSGTKADAFVLPLALGNHVDHATARDAALAEVGLMSQPCAFYEDLPYAARPGAADLIETAADSCVAGLTPVFVADPCEVRDAVSRKRRAALCYDSQIDDAVTDDIAQFCIRYAGRERLWANAAWQASKPHGRRNDQRD
ncbi:PIG-L deacetylase family protein [Granulicella arctica]|uniref:PIG-L deacetylase family protein n=1 Tax=Granulicella arctica TaxID=940613 RepID=UPI0021DF84CD|nr:PIG-L family deacetylase [Granulicella arctica]